MLADVQKVIYGDTTLLKRPPVNAMHCFVRCATFISFTPTKLFGPFVFVGCLQKNNIRECKENDFDLITTQLSK